MKIKNFSQEIEKSHNIIKKVFGDIIKQHQRGFKGVWIQAKRLKSYLKTITITNSKSF